MTATTTVNSVNLKPNSNLDFLWLELNRLCNLKCVHCYNDSSPTHLHQEALTPEDFRQILDSAAVSGCRSVQFIGGEPTLEKKLAELLDFARQKGFEFLEVYTNATNISDALLENFVENQINIAVSLYSHEATIHDLITTRVGSHARTVRNIKRMKGRGLNVRIGIIAMDQNRDCINETKQFAESLGISDVSVDEVRSVGRGANLLGNETTCDLNDLCGHCWKGSLCVSYKGDVYPCVMSECMNFGSVKSNSLEDLLTSGKLFRARQQVFDEVYRPKVLLAESTDPCAPQACCQSGIHSSIYRQFHGS